MPSNGNRSDRSAPPTPDYRYEAVAELGLWALMGAPIADLSELAAKDILRTLGVDIACVFELSRDGKAVTLRTASDRAERRIGKARLEPGAQFPIAFGVLDSQAVVVGDRDAEASFPPWEILREIGVSAGLTVPLLDKEATLGALSALSVRPRAFARDDVCALRGIANVLALAIARERAERRGKQGFRTLVENSPEAICRFDRDLRHLYVNPAGERAHGLPADAISWQTNRELGLGEPLVSRWELSIRQVFAVGREQTFESECALPTMLGQRWFHTRLVPEFGDRGQVESVLAVSSDVTELQRAKDAHSQLLDELIHSQHREQELLARLLDAHHGETRRLERALLVNKLSEREREILRLVAQGQTNREIGQALHLSPGTVKNHVSRLLPKLGAIDRTQAAVQAGELGLIEDAQRPADH
jgi:PAS domain S-box-containing protein